MSEADDLVERLRREKRRWKAAALAACSVVLMALAWYVGASRSRQQVERRLAEEQRALAESHRALEAAKWPPAQPALRPDAAP
jgi:hypothetical protein